MKKTIFLLSLTFFAQLNAKYFSVEIIRNNSTNLSAIVQEVNQAPPPSSFSLSAFNQVRPTSVRYLIDKRASGNLLNLMNNHPLWGLARLQQRYATMDTKTLARF